MQSDNINNSIKGSSLKTYYFPKVFYVNLNQTKENMKKIVITLFLVLFTSSVYAGSCPMMAKSIDDKIAEAQTLRDQGMAAHDAGDHAKSEELLNKALSFLKVNK
jgi:hypothetical protein